MAKVTKLARLFGHLGAGDVDAALTAARSIADDEERQGHRGAARLLRGSLKHNGVTTYPPLRSTIEMSSLSNMLIREPEGPALGDVELRAQTQRALRELVFECRHSLDLANASVKRRQTLLLSGPPGCGKTLTARALGHELGLPVYTARLSSIIGSYLGQTGSNLRDLFRFAQTTDCILLLDEFDAVARRRGRAEDIGELDRVVVSLLQELDHTAPAGLVIAATNLPEAIDPALSRRFHLKLTLPSPSQAELRRYVSTRAHQLGIGNGSELTRSVGRLAGKSYADVEKAIEDFRRSSLLKSLASNGE